MKMLSQIRRKFLKFLPQQPVASVAFQNPTLSPSRSVAGNRCRSPVHKVSIIPKEARRKLKHGSFSAREPGSPKVSCMGQVQCKKRKTRKHKKVQPGAKQSESVSSPDKVKKEKVLLWISRGSSEGPKQSGKTLVLEQVKTPAAENAPSLGTMKKFASGRGALTDFDAAVAG